MKPSRFLPSSNPPQSPFEQDLERSLNSQFSDIFQMLSSGLRFGDNFDGTIVELVTDTTPGVETAITHGLKRVPTGFLVLARNKAAHVFDGPSGKDVTTYNIQSDVDLVRVTLLIF